MSGLQEYVDSITAPEGYKRLLLGVHGLSRRKRERFIALVTLDPSDLAVVAQQLDDRSHVGRVCGRRDHFGEA